MFCENIIRKLICVKIDKAIEEDKKSSENEPSLSSRLQVQRTAKSIFNNHNKNQSALIRQVIEHTVYHNQ